MTTAELRGKSVAARTDLGTRLLKKTRKYKGPFVSLGEQLCAVRHAGIALISGRQIDRRLLEIERRANPAGAGEQVPSSGGFLLQPEFSRKIVKRMYNTGGIFSRCTQMPITAPNANALKFNQFDESSRANGSRLGGVSVYWQNEADQALASKPKFQLTELQAEKIIGLLYCTNEQVQDSDALDRWARYAFSSELLFRLENAIVAGTGAGQPQGVLTSPALVTVAKESGQGSGTVVSSNIEKMLGTFWSASYNSDSACWIYGQGLLPQLASLSTIVGTAGSEARLWSWATDADKYDLLAGFPAIQSEYCAVPGTLGDILLCDFSRYVVAMREELRADVSIHVSWLTDESAFRFIMRVNGQTIDRTPVTPLNGTTATSPFVALAAR